MKPRKPIIITLVIIHIFCAPIRASGLQTQKEKYRIIEVVLRSYMDTYSFAKGYKVYYIGVEMDGKDITGEFLKRFEGNVPPVKEYEPERHDPERIKKEGGIVLGIRGIERVGKSKVKVYGLTFGTGPGEGLNWIHDLKRRGRNWVIVDVASLNLG